MKIWTLRGGDKRRGRKERAREGRGEERGEGFMHACSILSDWSSTDLVSVM